MADEQRSEARDLTTILQAFRAGDKDAESRLMPLVYNELHALASRLMRRERQNHTLQATALVNEAYLRLASQGETDWKNRAHFYGVAAQVMRHILVDYARKKQSLKRARGVEPLPLDEVIVVTPSRLEEILIVEDALQRLEQEDARAAQALVYRFYGGLSIEEISEVMQIGERSVKRDLTYARAWMNAELKPGSQHASHTG